MFRKLIVRYAEFQGGALTLAWGVWFLWPHYDIARGLLFVVLGAGQLLGLLLNLYKLRRSACMGSVVAWLFVGILMAQRDRLSFAIPTAFALAVISAGNYIRIERPRSVLE